jgi:hypothetical protein
LAIDGQPGNYVAGDLRVGDELADIPSTKYFNAAVKYTAVDTVRKKTMRMLRLFGSGNDGLGRARLPL